LDIEKKEKEIIQSKEMITQLIGSLSSKYNLMIGKPNVQFFEGLDGIKKIYFAAASFKHQYASKNKILIDDRLDTIKNWINKGGIGIYHTSTKQTINELKKLGL
jgi:hypothetical protein